MKIISGKSFLSGIVLTFLLLLSNNSFGQEVACGIDCASPIKFKIPDISGQQGEQLCTEFLVCGFENIVAFTFTVSFNPNDLQILEVNPILPDLNFQEESIFTANESGRLGVLWFDLNVIGIDLLNETPLFEICFEIIGDPNTTDSIRITGDQAPIEFIQQDPDDPISSPTNVIDSICVNGGGISVSCPDEPQIYTSSCGSNNPGDGSFAFFLCGGVEPYSYNLFRSDGVILTNGVAGDQEEIIFTDLDPGESYVIQVIDATLQEIINQSVLIEVNSPLRVSIQPTDVTCSQNTPNGRLDAVATGGIGDYSYRWGHDPVNLQQLSLLPEGTYMVTVTDENGCEAYDTASIFTPEPFDVNLQHLIFHWAYFENKLHPLVG